MPGNNAGDNGVWEWRIDPKPRWLISDFKEIFSRWDLIMRFVRKDLLISYNQTLLGPVWVFLQPVLTTLVYVVIFYRIANISTDGIFPILFYLPGIIVWTFFFDCFTANMNIFYYNSQLFSKVFFPRLIIPISTVISTSVRLGIQLGVFLAAFLIYSVFTPVQLRGYLLILPIQLLLVSFFALGLGLIVSVYTAKYRDIENMVSFLLRLFMFATPVFFPLSVVPQDWRWLFYLNPLTGVIETFRGGFFGSEFPALQHQIISGVVVVIILITGLFLFKRREISSMDII